MKTADLKTQWPKPSSKKSGQVNRGMEYLVDNWNESLSGLRKKLLQSGCIQNKQSQQEYEPLTITVFVILFTKMNDGHQC